MLCQGKTQVCIPPPGLVRCRCNRSTYFLRSSKRSQGIFEVTSNKAPFPDTPVSTMESASSRFRWPILSIDRGNFAHHQPFEQTHLIHNHTASQQCWPWESFSKAALLAVRICGLCGALPTPRQILAIPDKGRDIVHVKGIFAERHVLGHTLAQTRCCWALQRLP